MNSNELDTLLETLDNFEDSNQYAELRGEGDIIYIDSDGSVLVPPTNHSFSLKKAAKLKRGTIVYTYVDNIIIPVDFDKRDVNLAVHTLKNKLKSKYDNINTFPAMSSFKYPGTETYHRFIENEGYQLRLYSIIFKEKE